MFVDGEHAEISCVSEVPPSNIYSENRVLRSTNCDKVEGNACSDIAKPKTYSVFEVSLCFEKCVK